MIIDITTGFFPHLGHNQTPSPGLANGLFVSASSIGSVKGTGGELLSDKGPSAGATWDFSDRAEQLRPIRKTADTGEQS